jgi:TRAP-type C4-dicarboxylate transport system permease small subunit
MGKPLEWLSHECARITRVLMLILGIMLILCLLTAVFFRYVVGYALSWPEELSMLLFTWVVFLAGSLGVREGFHVRLTFILKRLPPSVQNVMSIIITAFIISFGAVLLYSGKDMVSRTFGSVSATIGYPMALINSAAIVGGALIVIHGVRHLLMPEKEN